MSITMNKYVSTRSGVGGAASVRSRELILRIVTPSAAVLPGQTVEFTNLNDVAALFAANTPEYQYAQKYFGFVSKLSSGARRLSMSRWNKAATAPLVQGAPGVLGAERLSAIRGATNIIFDISEAANEVPDRVQLTVNFDPTATYEDVRAALQAALRADSNPQLATATVLYTAATGVFTITGSVTTPGSLIVVVPTTNPALDVGTQLNLTQEAGAASTQGFAAQTALDAINDSADRSDNFGSFGFIDSTSNPPLRLSTDDVVAIAAWNHAQNNKYMFLTPGTVPLAPAAYDALKGYSGTAYTISGAGNDFAEFCPGEIMAATDYERANASTNYMFTEFGNRTPQVTDTTTSDRMDALRANYVGQTMTAGQQLSFYQRGVLMGDSTAAVDMNVFANEIWFKDSIGTSLMNAFLGLPRVPANDLGRALLLTNMQVSIDTAVLNGTISVGKLLTAQQRSFVTLTTNDPDAWQQIQNIGYWVDIDIRERQTSDGRTEYYAVYLLLYSKDDQIRKVEGADTLI